MPREATAVVCTQGREPLLERTLEALLAQRGIDLEVIVVAEVDPTGLARVAPSAAAVRAVRAGACGLNHKRNRGLSEARRERVLFTDDDCVPDPDWARQLAAALETHPVATGRVLPLNAGGRASIRTGPRPRVFRGPIDRVLAWRTGCGNNMGVRRGDILELGGFREDLGVGTWSGAACDTELFFRAMGPGGGGVRYEPAAVVRHYQPESRPAMLAKRRRYYRALSYMARRVHPRSPAAWMMAAGRCGGAAALLALAAVSLRTAAAGVHWAELRGSLEGLRPPARLTAPRPVP